MKHINEYIRESLLDDEDDIVNRGIEATIHRTMPEKFVEWVQMENSGWCASAKRMVKNSHFLSKISVIGGRLNLQQFMGLGPFDIKKVTVPIPEDIKLGYVPTFIVSGESETLHKCREQLPTETANFMVVGDVKTGLDNFHIKCMDFQSDPGPHIKNLTLDIYRERPGLVPNEFDVTLGHITSDSDLKNVKINGYKNTTVILSTSTYGPQVALQAKKEVLKIRKTLPDAYVSELFVDVLYDMFPLKWIDKNWKGVDTLILKVNQSNGSWPRGSVSTIISSLRSGDLVLKKVNGEWIAFQKMIKTVEDEYLYFQ